MKPLKHTPAGAALSGLILDLFRLNSQVLTAGDRLVADLGLTSARWQILGTVNAVDRPQPVAWLARDMGPTARTFSVSSTTWRKRVWSPSRPIRTTSVRSSSS